MAEVVGSLELEGVEGFAQPFLIEELGFSGLGTQADQQLTISCLQSMCPNCHHSTPTVGTSCCISESEESD